MESTDLITVVVSKHNGDGIWVRRCDNNKEREDTIVKMKKNPSYNKDAGISLCDMPVWAWNKINNQEGVDGLLKLGRQIMENNT